MSRDEFDVLIGPIASLLIAAGFSQIRSELDGPFGSHFAEFASGCNAYRIVWDGKESWLVGEYSSDYGGSAQPSWNDLAVYRAGRHASLMDLPAHGDQLIEAMRAHLASYAA
jgi:hypothetical protein